MGRACELSFYGYHMDQMCMPASGRPALLWEALTWARDIATAAAGPPPCTLWYPR